jgi:hypothetical protein
VVKIAASDNRGLRAADVAILVAKKGSLAVIVKFLLVIFVIFLAFFAFIMLVSIGSQQASACSPGNASGENNTEIAFNYLRNNAELQLSSAGASIVSGNSIHESGGDPILTDNPDSNSGANGILHWLGDRLDGPTGLKNHKFQGRDWTDIYLQLDYLRFELTGSYRSTLEALRKAKTFSDIGPGVIEFEKTFEKSGDIASWPKRTAHAEDVFRRYGGGNPLSPSLGTSLCNASFPANLPTGIKVDSSPGRLVPIPGFEHETVDSRVLPNLMALVRNYKLRVGDCFVSPAELGPHDMNGEHPLGVGCDLSPDPAKGGTWEDVDRLAAWVEPVQNQPRAPFKWVGYNGDPNHGTGNHLHLSWDHGPAPPFTIVPWVKVFG